MAAMEQQKASTKKPQIAKQGQYRWHDFRDTWFRTAEGEIVVARTPNLPLIIFIISGVFGVVSYHGFWHTLAQIVALLAIIVWGVLEAKTGVNRFRRLIGKAALVAVIIVLILYFWK
jgi:hypothetical protein